MQEQINDQSMLRVGTILRGIYRIDSYLSSGGFGNTYVATNIEFDEKYAIKEFFMRGITERDNNQTTVSVSNTENINAFAEQKEKFKKEARRLRQLKNPHIVSVYDLFEENGTAYYVMDFIDGENLCERLKRTGKPMTEAEVSQILPQILDALQTVHDAGMWHLDLKPANIMMDKAGNVKLIDFGASKQLNSQKGGATTSTAISYTNGYAPREQMEQNYDKFGPWTDLYALGATLYNLLTNKRPPLPTDIDDDMSEDKHLALPMPNVSDKMKQLILCLMKTNRMQRPKTIQEVKEIKIEEKPVSVFTSITRENEEANEDETIIASKKEELKKTNIQIPTPPPYKENVATKDIDDNSDNHWWLWFILIACAFIGSFWLLGTCNSESYGTKDVFYSWGAGQYKGNLKHGEPDGHGIINYYDGTVFEGEFKDGVTNGHGTFISSNGVILFDGIYINGQRSEGLMTLSDGSKYTGIYLNGKPNGLGKLTSANGDLLFEGEFSLGNRLNGKGKEIGESQDGITYEYEGEYKNGLYNGKGTMKWSNGHKYEGEWKDGERTGHGAYTWPEKRKGYGYKYEGGFLNGDYHGIGIWYFVGGSSEKIKYKNGKEIR